MCTCVHSFRIVADCSVLGKHKLHRVESMAGGVADPASPYVLATLLFFH